VKDGQSKGIIQNQKLKERSSSRGDHGLYYNNYGSRTDPAMQGSTLAEGFCRSENDMPAKFEEIQHSISSEEEESYLENNSSQTLSESVDTYVKKDPNFLSSRSPGQDSAKKNTIDIINKNVNYFFDDKEISEISVQAELDRGRFLNEQDSFKLTGFFSEFGDRGDTPSERAQALPCKQDPVEEFMRDTLGRQSINVKTPRKRNNEKKVSMPILKFKEGTFGKKQASFVTAPTKGVPGTNKPVPKTINISNRITEGLHQLSDRVMGGSSHKKPGKITPEDINSAKKANDKEALKDSRFSEFLRKTPLYVKNLVAIGKSKGEWYEEDSSPEPQRNTGVTPGGHKPPPLSKLLGKGKEKEAIVEASDESPTFLGHSG
jgi:hypothetical protein